MGPVLVGSLGSNGLCVSVSCCLLYMAKSTNWLFQCSTGDVGPATNAKMINPSGLASAANAPDGMGGWLIADTNNNRIRRVFSNRSIITVVGNGSVAAGSDGLPGV